MGIKFTTDSTVLVQPLSDSNLSQLLTCLSALFLLLHTDLRQLLDVIVCL